ncbi:MAG: alpha/beta fold hydrolase [Promethearchaeota archaeon]|nr:MAG: alpha/beta fold hydrolase [Candidatus Lokiarchaeota archaeon]
MNSKNDFPQIFPLQDYQRKLRKKKMSGVFLVLVILVMCVISSIFPESYWGWINLFLVLLLVMDFILIYVDLNRYKIATLWDDFEYKKLVKQPFNFKAKDGMKQFAYIYIPESINLENTSKKLPAVIGLHGWGSHHREMDRYCLPIVQKNQCIYYTYDSVGQGLTPGDKSDFRQINDCQDFIDTIAALPYIDRKKIVVVGMSLGAMKAAVVAYPHPDVRGIIMMSGAYDLVYTKNRMSKLEYLLFKWNGFKFPNDEKELKKYSAVNYFRAEGICLRDDVEPTPNSARVFIMANKNDPVVRYENTLKAIQSLNLPPENYSIFEKGGHCFEGNEYWVANEINTFIKAILENELKKY